METAHPLRNVEQHLKNADLQKNLFAIDGEVVGGPMARHEKEESLLHRHSLSDTEVQVLRLAAQGNSYKQVAAALGLTEYQVRANMKTVISKLNANDRTHAVFIALRHAIVEL